MRRANNLRGRRPTSRKNGVGRYGNVEKRTIDGHKFASKAEAERYCNLKLMLKAKMITGLELQPRIPIIIKGVIIKLYSERYNKTGRTLTYVGDFKYFCTERQRWVIEDVKMKSGHRTEVYTIKRALVRAMGITIDEV